MTVLRNRWSALNGNCNVSKNHVKLTWARKKKFKERGFVFKGDFPPRHFTRKKKPWNWGQYGDRMHRDDIIFRAALKKRVKLIHLSVAYV